MVVLTGKLCLQWSRMQGQWPQWRDGTTMKGDGGFSVPVSYGSTRTSKEEELEYLLKAALLAVGAREVAMELVL